MLYIEDDNTIKLTRGDTARLTVPIINEIDGSFYDMNPNDILTFTMRKTVTAADFLVQKISHGNNHFHFLPQDTKGLKYGSYIYDVQLTTEAGDVYTVIVPTAFEVLTEVTY